MAAENRLQENRGEAPALVVLHYFGGSGASWDAVVDALPAYHRCIALDLCGFGKSHCPDEPMGVEDYADYVLERIRFLALDRYVIVGHSMGGKVAMALAARRPEGLESLVLLAPSPPTPEPMDDEARKELAEMFGDAEKIRAHLNSICADPLPALLLEQEIAQHLLSTRTAWQAWLERGSREDISDRTPSIDVPTIVLGGAGDKTFTPDFLLRDVLKHLPAARIQVVKHAGHLLPLEQPETVAEVIQRFVSSQQAFYS